MTFNPRQKNGNIIRRRQPEVQCALGCRRRSPRLSCILRHPQSCLAKMNSTASPLRLLPVSMRKLSLPPDPCRPCHVLSSILHLQAGFLGQIEMWLGQLRDEVKKLQELGLLLKRIGCFDPRLGLSSKVKPRSVVFAANTGGTSAAGTASAGSTSGAAPPPPLSPSKATQDIGAENEAVAVADTAGAQDEPSVSAGGDNVDSRAVPVDGRGVCENGGVYDVRAMENQTQEAVESLEFHLTVLQRSVDQAHINMRIASQEFSSLLHKVSFECGRQACPHNDWMCPRYPEVCFPFLRVTTSKQL